MGKVKWDSAADQTVSSFFTLQLLFISIPLPELNSLASSVGLGSELYLARQTFTGGLHDCLHDHTKCLWNWAHLKLFGGRHNFMLPEVHWFCIFRLPSQNRRNSPLTPCAWITLNLGYDNYGWRISSDIAPCKNPGDTRPECRCGSCCWGLA